jgi:tRNA-dihydrouridine synthase
LYRSVQWKNPVVGVNEMRRHYANYLKGLPNIKEYRGRLVILKEVEEIDEVLNEIIANYSGYEFERTVIQLVNYHEKCAV